MDPSRLFSKVAMWYVLSYSLAYGYYTWLQITGAEVAIKIVRKDRLNKKLAESLESEIAILKDIRHPNIVSLLDIQVSVQVNQGKIIVVWVVTRYRKAIRAFISLWNIVMGAISQN